MEDEARDQEQRGPGQVAERQNGPAREEFAQDVDVAQGCFVPGPRLEQSGPVNDLEDRSGHLPIEDHPAPHQQARTQHLESGIDRQRESRDRGDPEQRRFVPTQKNAVVDLQHVERAGEQEQVREEGEDEHRHQDGTDRTQPVLQDGPGERVAHGTSRRAGTPEPDPASGHPACGCRPHSAHRRIGFGRTETAA